MTIPNRSVLGFFGSHPNLKMYVPLSGELLDRVGGKTVTLTGSTGSVTERAGTLNTNCRHFASHAIGARYYAVGANSDYQFGSTLTAMAWLSIDQLATYDHIINKYYTPGAVGWGILRSSNSKLRWQVNNAGVSDAVANNPITVPGTWYHTALVIDGTSLFGYVDGIRRAGVANTRNPNTTSDKFKIGNRRQTVAEGCIGSIQEVALFDCALDAQDLLQYYRYATFKDHARKSIFFYPTPGVGGGAPLMHHHLSTLRAS